ncbi:hypothetical protein RND81_06G065300 [Saponaria officinalis]|uniref:ATP-dependent DNA helicase n=1 Tax=Saponaria officinalis TaxID=3572 RepID=A0AAW1K4E9_SAPOF
MSQISFEMHLNVLRLLMRVMETNPYAQFFRSLRDLGVQEWNRIVIRVDPTHDQHTHNVPTASQVSGIWVDDAPADSPLTQDIVFYARSRASHCILDYYSYYDPLQYPILFPYGETGWHRCIYRRNVRRRPNQQVESFPINEVLVQTVDDLLYSKEQVAHTKDSDKKVSCRDYYCYRLQIRIRDTSILLHCDRLLQQYIVDMYIKTESTCLDFIRHNQSVIRADLYQGIIDSYNAGETRCSNIVHHLILPATCLGCGRDMHCRYLNSMVLVHLYGKPYIFLPITYNPRWPEIERELLPFEEAQNRPDLIARIFRLKLIELIKDILNSESYDMHVCAEIPDEDRFPHLHAAVLKYMMHSPCGRNFPTNPCMRDRKCKNHYPREFAEFTTNRRNFYSIYRRRDGDKIANVLGAQLDNRWVVPYNPFLLAKYDCSTVKAVKYLNRIDPHAQKLLYQQFSEQYVWHRKKNDKLWAPRQSGFAIAAYRRGLLETDNSIQKCLEEASQYQLPFVLRRLFATLFIYYFSVTFPSNPRKVFIMTLKSISFIIESMTKSLDCFDFGGLTVDEDTTDHRRMKEIEEEVNISITVYDIEAIKLLNSEQRVAYNLIYENIMRCYRGIIAHAVASSGISASNIAGGRMANSRFKISLGTDEHLSKQIPKQSGLAELIRACRLIIWDEASMAKRQSIEHIERTLRDVCSCDTVFGGKTVVFGGDFRQVLPVIPKSTLQEAVNASFVLSPLWPTLTKIHLTVNMWAIHDLGFSDFALKVGNGSPSFENGRDIMLPRHILIFADQNCSLMDKMISSVYPDISLINLDPFRTTKKAILTLENEDADFINHMLVTKQVGHAFEYKSFDGAIDITTEQYLIEFLNTLRLSGLPPHHLVLKKNSPIILLRNLDPTSGLCNGTRLIFIGHHKGERVVIPRIPLEPSPSDKYPFNFRRKQFPLTTKSIPKGFNLPTTANGAFEIRPAFINLVERSQFEGSTLEDPSKHLSTFADYCSTLPPVTGVSADKIKELLFPFSLSDSAREWITDLDKTAVEITD